VGGRRITDDDTLEVVKMVFAGKINTEIISALRRCGAEAVGISGVAGHIIQARKRAIKKLVDPETGETQQIDFGHVGDVVKVDTRLLETLIRDDFLPVLSCLGADEEGNVYNINADTIAAEVAVSMRAEKLVCLTNVPGVLENVKDRHSVIPTVTLAEAREAIREKVVSRGMIPKLTALVAAVERGVTRAHVLDGCAPHALLVETLTAEGVGTMVVASDEMRRYRREEL
jgi:acetylglutamate kinase